GIGGFEALGRLHAFRSPGRAFLVTTAVQRFEYIFGEFGGFFENRVGKFVGITDLSVACGQLGAAQQLLHDETDIAQRRLEHQATTLRRPALASGASGAPARAGTMLAARNSTKLRTAGSTTRSTGLTAVSSTGSATSQ